MPSGSYVKHNVTLPSRCRFFVVDVDLDDVGTFDDDDDDDDDDNDDDDGDDDDDDDVKRTAKVMKTKSGRIQRQWQKHIKENQW